MSFLTIAEWALEDTRKLLKPSLKSGNKSYVYSPFSTVTDWWAATDEQRAKWSRRNACQFIANTALKIGSVVPIEGLTLLEAGEELYKRASLSPKTWYGNCAEQALIALYRCSSRGVQARDLFLITYKKGSFEHSLVQVGVNPNGPDKAAHCDPWLNIACYHDAYSQKADAKLSEWTREGKRLPDGADSWGRTNWVEPSNIKILGFAVKSPTSQNALDRPRTFR